jgi:hypothetical protein
MMVVRLSALGTGRLYPLGDIPSTHFFYKLNRPQDHNAENSFRTMKISSDGMLNRNRDQPTCSVVPQPTAPPRSPTVRETSSEPANRAVLCDHHDEA